MMLGLLVASAVAVAAPSPPQLAEAAHAIAAGRLQQARTMIGNAVAAGSKGVAIDRLIADLAFAEGRSDQALQHYEALLLAAPKDAVLLERAAICALRIGKVDRAGELANRAARLSAASWQAWNALGVVADLRRDWGAADAAYAEGVSRAPDQPELLNNRGWSLILRGDWQGSVAVLEQAARLAPKSRRIADNLELARAALADDLPRRRPGESDDEWAARLNDAGVVARLLGDEARATAAFTRAIDLRSVWYERAWNNLKRPAASQ